MNPESATEQPAERFVLETRTTPRATRALVRAALRCLADDIFDQELLCDLELCLYEACSNAMKHGYSGQQAGQLRIVLTHYPEDRITAEVTDWGRGFGSLPVEIQNAPQESETGRGLFIIQEVADELTITRQDDATTLLIVLKTRNGS